MSEEKLASKYILAYDAATTGVSAIAYGDGSRSPDGVDAMRILNKKNGKLKGQTVYSGLWALPDILRMMKEWCQKDAKIQVVYEVPQHGASKNIAHIGISIGCVLYAVYSDGYFEHKNISFTPLQPRQWRPKIFGTEYSGRMNREKCKALAINHVLNNYESKIWQNELDDNKAEAICLYEYATKYITG